MISKRLLKRIAALGLSAVLFASAPVTAFATEGAEDFGVLTESGEDDSSFDEIELSASDETDDGLEDELVDDELVEDDEAESGEEPEVVEDEEDSEAESEEELIDDEKVETAKLLTTGTVPTLTGESVWRTSATTATVKFSTDTAGTYYYKVTDSPEAPLAEGIKNNNIGSGAASVGTVTIESVDGLSEGARYVHIVVESTDGQLSAVHTIDMPCDIYYSEDFESYDVDVCTGQEGYPLSPILQDAAGKGGEFQKIVNINDESGKALQLYGISGSAAHVYVPLPTIPDNYCYVYEGKFNIDEAGTNDGIRFDFMKGYGGSSNEAGMMVKNHQIYKHFEDTGYSWGRVDYDEWYSVKIVALPSAGTYSIYIDDRCYENIPCPGSLPNICLSAVWDSKAYFDDLKFYAAPTCTVTFDCGDGSSVDSQAVPQGGYASKPADPVLEDYTFVKWLFQGNEFDFENTPITEDITLTAKWKVTIPRIKGCSVWRTGATTASIKFYTNTSGHYRYYVSDSETPPTIEEMTGKDLWTPSGDIQDAGTMEISEVVGLSSGPKFVHVLVEDEDKVYSNILTIPMPYDVYYFDDFESYPVDTTVYSEKLSPWWQRAAGRGSEYQKIVETESGKALQIESSQVKDAFISYQIITVPKAILDTNRDWVYEGDFCVPNSSPGEQMEMRFRNYNKQKTAGIFIKGNKIYESETDAELCDLTTGEWHHAVIVVHPYLGTYDVKLDGTLIGEGLACQMDGINELWISPGCRENPEGIYLAQFDNMEFSVNRSSDGKVRTMDDLVAALEDESVSEVVVEKEIEIPDGTVIDGHGKTVRVPVPYVDSDASIVSTASSYRVFSVPANAKVTLKNMTVMGGSATGVIYGRSGSYIKMENVHVERSQTGYFSEGGCVAVLVDCSFYRNIENDGSDTGAAGIQMGSSTGSAESICVLDRCSFSGNRSALTFGGGAVCVWGRCYANNTVVFNNAAVQSGSAFSGGNNNKYYLMNCTVMGNLSTSNSERDGAIRLWNSGDSLDAVNCIIADNYVANGDSRRDISHMYSGSEARLYSCIYGALGGTSNTLDDLCAAVPATKTAVYYDYSSIRVGASDQSNDYYHPENCPEKTSGKHDYYIQIRSSSDAVFGGVSTYFDYDDINDIRMGYDSDDGIALLTGSSVDDLEDYAVTSYCEGGSRLGGVIGASAYYGTLTEAAIEGASVWRTDETTASVKFHSSAAGTYYYIVNDSEEAPSKEEIIANRTGVGRAASGTTTIASLNGLSAGAKYVHIVVDRGGKLSNVHTIAIPYDVYYYDDFEAYEDGTYVNAAGEPLSPLRQVRNGNGDENQKVIDRHNALKKVLQLETSHGSVSEQCVDISGLVDKNREWVLEAGVSVQEGDELLLSLSDTEGSDFGIWISGSNLYYGTVSEENKITEYLDRESFRHIVLKFHPSNNTCDVIVSGYPIAMGLPADTSKIDRIKLATGDPSFYDRIQFSMIEYHYAPQYTVSFDSNGGSAVSPQTVNDGELAVKPEDPVLEDYIFDGWMLDGGRYDFESPVTEDIELKAFWAQSIDPVVEIEGWVYGEEPNQPYVTQESNPGDGAVTFTYKVKDADDSTYTQEVPTEAGDYTVRARVAGTAYYYPGTGTADFTISKANKNDLTITDTIPANSAVKENKLVLPELPAGAVYSSTEILVEGDVPGLIVKESISLDESILKYDTTAKTKGAQAEIVIPVNGGNNYNDFRLVVTVSTDIEEGIVIGFKDGTSEFTYTGTKIMPEIEVRNNGKTLTPGVDYTVTYSGNLNVSRDKAGAVKAGGKVTIKGKGNLSDSKVLTFTIRPKSLEESEEGTLPIKHSPIYIAAGQKIPAPVITYGSYKLASKDYTVRVITEEDGKKLLVEGKGNFKDSLTIPVSVVEDKKQLKKFTVVVDTSKPVYFDPYAAENKDEQAMRDTIAQRIKVYDSNDKIKSAETALSPGENYLITFPADVINAGKKSITIVGQGEYTGSVAKSITIKPLVVKSANGNGSIEVDREKIKENGYDFRQGGVTIGEDIRVFYNNADGVREHQLAEGKDYKVTYTNNKAVSKAGKPAQYSITFLGNYKGTPAIKNTSTSKLNVFTIVPKPISDESGAEANGVVVCVPNVAYTGKAGTYYSKPVVTLNGSTLAASNYTTTYYLVGEDTPITSKNKITIPDGKDEVIVEAHIRAKGSDPGKGNYSGTIIKTYRVIRQKANEVYDLSKARITIRGKLNETTGKYQKFSGIPYNGMEREVTQIDPTDGKPYGEVVVEYKIGNAYVALDKQDYKINYLNNINKGKAIIVIEGTNIPGEDGKAFVGSKSTTFSITTFNLKKFLSSILGG
ncbi:MAG: InlB B-repeat-containing protein [Butyrivibrio sp.]|nr:InlB B-repeat-containing protein [Butyrivibrio sp.]